MLMIGTHALFLHYIQNKKITIYVAQFYIELFKVQKGYKRQAQKCTSQSLLPNNILHLSLYRGRKK
jgi:hypothetical protein